MGSNDEDEVLSERADLHDDNKENEDIANFVKKQAIAK
jgi:hypothetical protein